MKVQLLTAYSAREILWTKHLIEGNRQNVKTHSHIKVALAISLLRKDTLQTETSDVELDEIQVFVSVVVLFFQCADSIALRNG